MSECGDGIPDGVPVVRDRRERHEGRRPDPGLHIACQSGNRVMRLVDDHERPLEIQKIGEGKPHRALVFEQNTKT